MAAGKGSGDLLYDIVPNPDNTGADESILYHRISSTEAGVRMPPLARTVVHGEASAMLAAWINDALPALSGEIENEEACTTAAPGP